MDSNKEEMMFEDFIAKHYRRMLLSLDAKTDLEDMSDEQAKSELIAILNSKGKQRKIPAKRSTLFTIISLAASIILVMASILYFNQLDTKKTELVLKDQNIPADTNENIKQPEKKPSQTVHYDLDKSNEWAKYDTIALPLFYSTSEEVFSFSQRSDKKPLDWESFRSLLTTKFSDYQVVGENSAERIKLIAKKSPINYSIHIQKEDNSIIITSKSKERLNSNSQEYSDFEQFKRSLKNYLKEIAR